MKRKIIVIVAIIIILIASFLIGTGFRKRSDVVLVNYSISEDGSAITLNVGVPTSMGYVRGFKDNGGGVKPHYLTFYSTFGGLNSSLGARKSYVLNISPDDTAIYFNRANGGYEIVLAKDEETGQWLQPTKMGTSQSVTFQAKILEINDNNFLIEPVEGSEELKNADQITVPMKNMEPSPEPEVDDIIEIAYSGEIAESYPAEITEVYSIKVVKEVEKVAMIPMVMVDGELYLTTGYESTVEGRCGVMDGEITSTVHGSEKPTENNQSNFGTGYGYQIGPTEGTIEIYMNGKWWVYATEEVRQEIQFPEENTVSFHEKTFNKSDLSEDTLEWLEWYNSLTEEEQLSTSYIPADLYELCGYPTAEVTETKANDELPDKEAFVAINIFTNESKPLTAEDGLALSDILESDSWNTEATTDCLSNIEITINGAIYKYHSGCGTFNDNTNKRYLSLDDKTQNLVNTILAEYISLVETEVPVE